MPRRLHHGWTGFSRVNDDNKVKARCNICKQLFAKTAYLFLISHRKRCIEENSDAGRRATNPSQLNSSKGQKKLRINTNEIDNIFIDNSTNFSDESSDSFSPLTMSQDINIDWTGFSKLRNETSNKIEAAICRKCKKIYQIISQQVFDTHRNKCLKSKDWRHGNSDLAVDAEKDDDSKQGVSDIKEISMSIHILLAKFFFTANIPFKQVENQYFLEFVQALVDCQFNYKPPCRKSLPTVVEKMYETNMKRKKHMLEDTDSVLIVDEWRNRSTNKKYLLFFLRNVNICRAFLRCYDITRESESIENLKKHINEAIAHAHELFKTDVVAIVTDSDKKIVRSASLAKTIHHKPLIQTTCASDGGYLLVESFVDEDLLVMIQEILHTFKENPMMESLLISKGGKKLKSLEGTRFYFLLDCCSRISENIEVLRDITQLEDIDIPATVNEYINNPEFEEILLDLISYLKPICKLIDNCQNPKYNVADATEEWLKLVLPSNKYDQELSDRKDKVIWPVGYAANLLHHKYAGKRLDEAQLLVAAEYLEESMDDQVRTEYTSYRSSQDYFQLYADNCDDPISYWSLVGWKFPNLSKFARKILIIPASAIQIEPLFSKWTYAHDKNKDILSDDNSACLIDVYYSLVCQSNVSSLDQVI